MSSSGRPSPVRSLWERLSWLRQRRTAVFRSTRPAFARRRYRRTSFPGGCSITAFGSGTTFARRCSTRRATAPEDFDLGSQRAFEPRARSGKVDAQIRAAVDGTAGSSAGLHVLSRVAPAGSEHVVSVIDELGSTAGRRVAGSRGRPSSSERRRSARGSSSRRSARSRSAFAAGVRVPASSSCVPDSPVSPAGPVGTRARAAARRSREHPARPARGSGCSSVRPPGRAAGARASRAGTEDVAHHPLRGGNSRRPRRRVGRSGRDAAPACRQHAGAHRPKRRTRAYGATPIRASAVHGRQRRDGVAHEGHGRVPPGSRTRARAASGHALRACRSTRPPPRQRTRRRARPARSEIHPESALVMLGSRPAVEVLPRWSVFVCSSRSEAFPLATLEAMAMGIPVVATTVGGIPEQIDHLDSGVLVRPDDPEAIATWLVRLRDDAELRTRLGDAGATRVRREFTLGRQAEGLHRAYLTALNRRFAPPRVRRAMATSHDDATRERRRRRVERRIRARPVRRLASHVGSARERAAPARRRGQRLQRRRRPRGPARRRRRRGSESAQRRLRRGRGPGHRPVERDMDLLVNPDLVVETGFVGALLGGRRRCRPERRDAGSGDAVCRTPGSRELSRRDRR